MSTNFTGVTFAKQKVTPSDDAIIRRAILPDGILYGCELTYSGSTLTMAAGQLLICGRQIRHPASQNWAVIDATSGFARLLLTIDLTKTATKESFEQVVDSIEYASAEDGFPDLEQTDINVSGSRYQVVACVVSLGTGGITGIVSQLGMSVVDSSGGLNFSVVGGTTQPSDPVENLIWVNTDVPITGYVFSATEPAEPVAGMVWFKTGNSSPVAFNALKKNGIQVCPLSAAQYIDGAWVSVTAKSYQGGEWVEWVTYLFNDGDTCDDITGGWSNSGYTYTGTVSGASTSYTKVAPTVGNTIKVSVGAELKVAIAGTANKIDLTDAKTVAVDVESVVGQAFVIVTTSKALGSNYAVQKALTASSAGTTVNLDVSSLSGSYYIAVFTYGSTNVTTRSAEVAKVRYV